MALANLDDVRRYLRGATVTDDALSPLLEAVTEWVKDRYHRNWDVSGSVTETFYEKQQGDILKLRNPAPTSVSVKVYLSADGAGSDLSSGLFLVMAEGRVELPKLLNPSPTGLRPEQRDIELRTPTRYAKVEVSYTAAGSVPTPVREAVAMTVAATYAQSELDVSGLASERLGDYSYQRAGDKVLVIPARASAYLKVYSGRRRAVTT